MGDEVMSTSVDQSAALTELERRILDFEGLWFRSDGAKGAAIRERFDGMSGVAYFQILVALVKKRAAWEYAPRVLERVRSRIDGRCGARSRLQPLVR
jgi:hypothetical protein